MAKQVYFIKSGVSLSINGIYNEPIVSEFTMSPHERELEDNCSIEQLKLQLSHTQMWTHHHVGSFLN